MIRSLVAVVVLAGVPFSCGANDQPGQVEFLGTLTVINRTVAEVTVTSGPRVFNVPACDEVTESDFPLNWWDLTSSGRDTFHSGGGDYGPTSYLLVTDVVEQRVARPNPLPACEGLLQPAQH